jgi:hypothetical protein
MDGNEQLGIVRCEDIVFADFVKFLGHMSHLVAMFAGIELCRKTVLLIVVVAPVAKNALVHG